MVFNLFSVLFLLAPFWQTVKNGKRMIHLTLKAENEKSERKTSTEKTSDLRKMLSSKEITIMPCCYDGLSAKLVESSGFNLTFMTGFGVSASYGLPDTGLVSSTEMVAAANIICSSLKRIPCIGDGDTGYGNEMNVMRTVRQYCQAGLSGIMIEDQVAPKRCGHVKGKQVVPREEAYRRVRAAVRARNQCDRDFVVLARTDARVISLEEAITRCKMFRELGADWTFLEAPQSEAEMIEYCSQVDGPKLANMLEFGMTPVLPPSRLQDIGFTVAAYPLSLLSASTRAMQGVLDRLKAGEGTEDLLVPFGELKGVVGFEEYQQEMDWFL